MTRDQLATLARRLLDGCRDSVTGEKLYSGESSTASVEDVEAAARYLRDCGLALAVGTVAHGPYIAPGDWMRPWVRDVLCLSFRSGPRLFFTGGDVPAYTVTTLGLPGGRS